MIEQTVANIDNSLNKIDHYYQYLLTNRSVRSGLFKRDFEVHTDTYDSVQDLRSLMFSLITTNEELNSALYISNEGNVVTSLSGVIYPDLWEYPMSWRYTGTRRKRYGLSVILSQAIPFITFGGFEMLKGGCPGNTLFSHYSSWCLHYCNLASIHHYRRDL